MFTPRRMSRRPSETAQKTGAVPRAQLRAKREAEMEMFVPCHQAAVRASVVRVPSAPSARAQSRLMASTNVCVAMRTAWRASEPCALLPPAASHRTRQIAPKVATRRRVHCCSIQASSSQPGHPAVAMPSRMKSEVRGATSPVREPQVEMSQSIAGTMAGHTMKA